MRTLIFRGYFAGVSVSPAAENAFLYSPRKYMRRRTPYPNEDPGSPPVASQSSFFYSRARQSAFRNPTPDGPRRVSGHLVAPDFRFRLNLPKGPRSPRRDARCSNAQVSATPAGSLRAQYRAGCMGADNAATALLKTDGPPISPTDGDMR